MRSPVKTITAAACLLTGAAPGAEPGPAFNDKGELQQPANYREWVFVTSGLGMTYGPNRTAPGEAPNFSNVFVNPKAYRAFMQTGQWPEGTMFVLEIRRSAEEVSIDTGGRTQAAHVALEASVKDSARYPGAGWAYFSFDSDRGLLERTAALPRTAGCHACHERHGAVEWTFTQFYPQQFEVARKLGTVRADYDPKRKLEDRN